MGPEFDCQKLPVWFGLLQDVPVGSKSGVPADRPLIGQGFPDPVFNKSPGMSQGLFPGIIHNLL